MLLTRLRFRWRFWDTGIAPSPPPAQDALLMEDGSFLLQEDNGLILLE
jgi:hypothetical protein